MIRESKKPTVIKLNEHLENKRNFLRILKLLTISMTINHSIQQNTECRVGYCIECLPTSSKDCKECLEDYKLEKNGFGYIVCRPDFFTEGCEIENCEACKTKNSTTCMSCANGFFESPSKNSCLTYAYVIFTVCILIIITPPILYWILYCCFKCCNGSDKTKKSTGISNLEKFKEGIRNGEDGNLIDEEDVPKDMFNSGLVEKRKEFTGLSQSPFVVVNNNMNKSAMAKIKEEAEDGEEEKRGNPKLKTFSFERLAENRPQGDLDDGIKGVFKFS